MPDELEIRLDACGNADQLRSWVHLALTAPSLASVSAELLRENGGAVRA
jgi:hypothetical protein